MHLIQHRSALPMQLDQCGVRSCVCAVDEECAALIGAMPQQG